MEGLAQLDHSLPSADLSLVLPWRVRHSPHGEEPESGCLGCAENPHLGFSGLSELLFPSQRSGAAWRAGVLYEAAFHSPHSLGPTSPFAQPTLELSAEKPLREGRFAP